VLFPRTPPVRAAYRRRVGAAMLRS